MRACHGSAAADKRARFSWLPHGNIAFRSARTRRTCPQTTPPGNAVEYDGPATLVQNALVVQAQIRIAVWTDPAGSLQWAGHFVEPAPGFSVQVGPATLRIAGCEPAPV